MPNPACGVRLGKATSNLAILQIVVSGLVLVQNSLFLWKYVPEAMEEHETNMSIYTRVYTMKATLTLLSTTYFICSLLMGFVLYAATKQRDLRRCRQWLIFSCLLTILFIVDLMMQGFSMRASIAEVVAPSIGTILMFYMIWVVLAYMEDLRLGGCEPMSK